MTQEQQVLLDVAKEMGIVPPQLISSRMRTDKLVAARVEITRRLHALEVSSPLIARAIGRHHTTVLYYLGRLGNRKYVGHARKVAAPKPKPKRRWRKLVSYAGAEKYRRNHYTEV